MAEIPSSLIQQRPFCKPDDTLLASPTCLPTPPPSPLSPLQSTSNVEGIISSDPSLSNSKKHPLTEDGVGQSFAAGKALYDLVSTPSHQLNPTIQFVSSPFARTRQTTMNAIDGFLSCLDPADDFSLNGQVCDGVSADTLNDATVYTDFFRERFFGKLDGMKLSTYAYVWPVDKMDTINTGFGCESVDEVYERVNKGIALCERRWSQQTVVIVSHADTLQILQTGGARGEGKGGNIGDFSDYRFKNGEVRVLRQGELPEAEKMEPPARWSQGNN